MLDYFRHLPYRLKTAVFRRYVAAQERKGRGFAAVDGTNEKKY